MVDFIPVLMSYFQVIVDFKLNLIVRLECYIHRLDGVYYIAVTVAVACILKKTNNPPIL